MLRIIAYNSIGSIVVGAFIAVMHFSGGFIAIAWIGGMIVLPVFIMLVNMILSIGSAGDRFLFAALPWVVFAGIGLYNIGPFPSNEQALDDLYFGMPLVSCFVVLVLTLLFKLGEIVFRPGRLKE